MGKQILFTFAVVWASLSWAVDFSEVSQKIFQVHCLDCHSNPGAAAGLNLSSYADVMAAGVVEVGKPAESYIIQKLEAGEMPMDADPLSASEIALVRKWIEDGAKDAPPPVGFTLKSVEPRFGPLSGGVRITVRGESLDTTKTVTVDGMDCTDIQIVDKQTLTCKIPSRKSVGQVAVRISDGKTDSEVQNVFEYRLDLAPTYESLLANIFKPKCLRCHSGENPKKNLDLSTYGSALSHRRAVIPYDTKKSRVYKKTSDGEMPQGGPRLPKEEVAMIGRWIQKGAPEK